MAAKISPVTPIYSGPPNPRKQWDENPPIGFPGIPVDGGLVAIDPLPQVFYILEQIKCTKTNQVWLSARSTKDANDNFIPINDVSLNNAIAKYGRGSIVKTKIYTAINQNDLLAQVSTTQGVVTTIGKNNPSVLGNKPVGVIYSGISGGGKL